MSMGLREKYQEALEDEKWKNHEVGAEYELINRDGSVIEGWGLTYYPILESYNGQGEFIEYDLPRCIIEKYRDDGKLETREVPFKFIRKKEEQ